MVKFAVDKIENDIVILENIDDCTLIQVNIKEFDFKINEKDIVFLNGNKYALDKFSKRERLNRIRQKMDKLKTKR